MSWSETNDIQSAQLLGLKGLASNQLLHPTMALTSDANRRPELHARQKTLKVNQCINVIQRQSFKEKEASM